MTTHRGTCKHERKCVSICRNGTAVRYYRCTLCGGETLCNAKIKQECTAFEREFGGVIAKVKAALSAIAKGGAK